MEFKMKCGRSVLGAVVLLAFLAISPAATALVWEDGDTHDIAVPVADFVNYVRSATTVNVLEGGDIPGWLEASSGGIANIMGGSVATHVSGQLRAMTGGEVNIYSGTVGSLKVQSTGLATVYGDAFTQDGVLLNATVTQILNTTGSNWEFTLEVLDGSGAVTMTIPVLLETGASLSLGYPQTAPDIKVYPALLEYDFGDVEIGVPVTYVVQISNIGSGDLEVSSLSLDAAGSADFSITAAPSVPFMVIPDESLVVDVEITYTPSVEGLATTTLFIGSDDGDEPVVAVALTGVGIVVEIPPTQQIQAILDFYDASVAEGTLLGYGPGNSPAKRLKALRNMLVSASTLITAEAYEQAIDQLCSVAKKTDGEKRPPDFVVGEATAALNQMVDDLIEALTL